MIHGVGRLFLLFRPRKVELGQTDSNLEIERSWEPPNSRLELACYRGALTPVRFACQRHARNILADRHLRRIGRWLAVQLPGGA